MAKKGGFSFDGMVDVDADAPAPIEGVKQRGAGEDKPPQAKSAAKVRKTAAEPVPTPARRGRPPKPRTVTEARPSFGLDPETHALFKIWLLRRGVSMQDYLEEHIRGLVKGEKL